MLRFPLLSLGLFVFVALLNRVPHVEAAVTKNPSSVSNHTYDYIVVGGGLAGLTVSTRSRAPPRKIEFAIIAQVASRLSENSAISVLVIEAGNDDRNDPRVYDIYQYGAAFNSELDWSYPTDQHKSIRAYVSIIFYSVLPRAVLDGCC